ncbi:MAG: hypothetical protein JWO63_1585 [Frankiales bacterium]|nr:hypothetical protein [Frankiales bacterium]
MNGIRIRALGLIGTGILAALTSVAVAPHAGAATPACGNSALTITHTPTQGTTGHGSFVLLYRNASAATCSIYGYPGLDALNSTGHVLAHATRTLHGFAGGVTTETTAVLAPGYYASATVEWMNFNPVTSGACAFSTSVATTPANTTHTVRFPLAVSVCSLQVHPTVAGTSGNDAFARAQADWLHGATVDSASHNLVWTAAVNHLKAAGSAYATQIALLKQLMSIPETSLTPAQIATASKDLKALDVFFGTVGLYS